MRMITLPLWAICSCNDQVLAEETNQDQLLEYVDISSVSQERGIERTESFRFGDAPSRARRIVREGDVLVSTVRTYLKAIAKVDALHSHCIASTGFAVLRSKNNFVDKEFLAWLLKSNDVLKSIIINSKGISYPAITSSDLMDIRVRIPVSLGEQKLISDFLNRKIDRLEAIISKLQNTLTQISTYRQSLITRAVTKGLDPNVEMKDSGVEWIGDIPKHWQISTLGRIGTFKGGDAFPVNLQGRSDNEISFYKVANLGIHKESIYLKKSENTIAKEDAIALKANIINPGSIVYAKIGAALLLNRRRIVNEPCCIDNNMTAFTLRTGNLLWAYYFLSTIDFGMYTCPATVPSLSEGRQSQIPIAIPPMNEQIEIGEYISSRLEKFQELYDSIIEMINNMKEYRSSLISAAVTGQLAIEEAEE